MTMDKSRGEIVVYQAGDGLTRVDVRFAEGNVWLTQAQLIDLYHSSKSNISEHIKHILEDSELTEDIPSGESMEERLLTKESAFEIHRILHRLEEPYKEVFSLRTFGELPFRQIGDLFGKTESWARVTYHRAKLKIKEELQ